MGHTLNLHLLEKRFTFVDFPLDFGAPERHFFLIKLVAHGSVRQQKRGLRSYHNWRFFDRREQRVIVRRAEAHKRRRMPYANLAEYNPPIVLEYLFESTLD